MPKVRALPTSAESWISEARHWNISPNDSVHEAGYTASASNIKAPQFLLLRAVWDDQLPATKFPGAMTEHLEKKYLDMAKTHLQSVPGWSAYLDSIKQGHDRLSSTDHHRSLGTYSLVRDNQMESFKVDCSKAYVQKVEFNALDPATRRNLMQEAHATPTRHGRHVATPTRLDSRTMTTRAMTHYFNELAMRDYDTIHDPTPAWTEIGLDTEHDPTTLSPLSPLRGADARAYAAVIDEQIVNEALISFAQALLIHSGIPDMRWSLHRMPFTVKSGSRKVYAARVDGVLRQGNRILAIAKVKPFLRERTEAGFNGIRKQEAAQMAAWIAEFPPAHKGGSHEMRLLLSQDRHEIYVTTAIFDRSYTEYITGRSRPNDSTGFLTLQQYGPFSTMNSKHMDSLGAHMLGFAMQMAAERD